jgi:hypothetical protein
MDVANLGSVGHFNCNDFSDGHVCAVHHSVGQSSREQPELSGVDHGFAPNIFLTCSIVRGGLVE